MEKEIIYTKQASEKLDKSLIDLVRNVEHQIRKSKNYPGEDKIEVTAADVEKIFERVTLGSAVGGGVERLAVMQLASLLYIGIGAAVLFLGLFYEDILEIYSKDPTRLIMIVGGVVSAIIGFYMRKSINDRNKRAKSLRTDQRFSDKLEQIASMESRGLIPGDEADLLMRELFRKRLKDITYYED